MRLKEETSKQKEPDLTSLINVVFLILIFFIVAGALRPFSARNIELAKVARDDASGVAPGRLVIQSDGSFLYRGQMLDFASIAGAISADEALDKTKVFTVVADARVPAGRLLDATRGLREAGLTEIAVMTERERR